MKKIVTFIVWFIVIGMGLLGCGHNNSKNRSEITVDTTKYTDVVLINNSIHDSVIVYVTLQNTESIIGLFGMDSSDIFSYCYPDSIPCVGRFWVKKGIEYHLGTSRPLMGVIITWGIENQSCPAAQNILDSNGNKLYQYGINNFEFTVNTWWQNNEVIGNGESFDITCVDGLHSILRQSVTSFGPRDEIGLHPNFGAFWDFGYKDNTGKLQPYIGSTNGVTLEECVNIPGVYPYGCDWGYMSHQPPTPCNKPKYPVMCSTKWGNINTSQTNRQGQGGKVICEFMGFIGDPQPTLLR